MTDSLSTLPTQLADPSQTISPSAATGHATKSEPPSLPRAETVEEEPYTIKCICNFSDDDGNTIYCETCDTWQHIDCFYPDNREEAIREDFAHSCAECKPRPLNREKAIERTLRLKNAVFDQSAERKPKRPPAKGQRKRPKSEQAISYTLGSGENVKQTSPIEGSNAVKKPKSSHRPSQSISSQVPKRSPSFNNTNNSNTNNNNSSNNTNNHNHSNGNSNNQSSSRSNGPHPPSPATTPPDLPEDFQIHHFSEGFCSLYDAQDVPETQSNSFASLAIPTAMSRWLREPETMKREVGRTPAGVFQEKPANLDETKPKLEIQESTRTSGSTTLRWRSLRSPVRVEKDVPLIELNGEVGFQKDYCANPDNLWTDLSSPLPFVFFHPILPLYIDTRKEGSLARYVRRSCKPNAQLDTYLSPQNEYCFWLVSDRYVSPSEQITLPWDFRLERTVCSRWLNLLGLNEDDDANQDESAVDESEYVAISNWIDRILSEYGGCACNQENNCTFARFHRQYLHGRNQLRGSQNRKKQRKARHQTLSPKSTGHATNSRAASEGHGDDGPDGENKYESASSRSKPPSRGQTPQARQGSFDQLGILTEPTDRDKRKVAMVEDSFRRMEQHHPARKKKRVSEGNSTSGGSRTKSRKDSVAAGSSHYVDNGTSRSKSGSPSSNSSPNLASHPFKPTDPGRETTPSVRPSPPPARSQYRNASVQTDPVSGEWFSESKRPPRARRRIISLTKRLLANRCQARTNGCPSSPAPFLQSTETAMDVDPPMVESKEVGAAAEDAAPTESTNGVAETSTATSDAGHESHGQPSDTAKVKSADLRVQLPPVPAFDNAAALFSSTATTPVSSTSNYPPSPFGPGTLVNGAGAQPSPIKKKLSLSDYTKSRMNKGAGKPGVSLKVGLPSPAELKVETVSEPQSVGKSESTSPVTKVEDVPPSSS